MSFNTYGDTHEEETGSVWAVSVLLFAAMLLMLSGFFHIIQGVAALLDDGYLVTSRNYAFDLDTTTWGWVHLLNGVILLLSGIGLVLGAIWARLVVLVLVVFSSIINFVYIPYAPVWSIVQLAMGAAIFWAIISVPTNEDNV